MAQNTAQGLVERDEVHVESVTVGFLADPNDSQIRWCVRETGHGAVVFASRWTGAVVSRQEVRFDSKYWLVQPGGKVGTLRKLLARDPSIPAGRVEPGGDSLILADRAAAPDA